MKKSLELKETRSGLVSKLEEVHSLATSEKRELTKTEGKNVDSYIDKIDDLDMSITRAEKIEAELRANVSVAGAPVQTVKADKRYSLLLELEYLLSLWEKQETILKQLRMQVE